MNINKKKMYVPERFRVSFDNLEEPEDITCISITDIVRANYAVYHDKPDFDGGLNIFDELKSKLSMFYHDVELWNVAKIKDVIRDSNHPEEMYMLALDTMLTQEMCDCYGF